MKQIEKNRLCYYCLGCQKEELENFNPVNRCKNFVPSCENWQELLQKELINKWKQHK